MTSAGSASIHASAVLAGNRAVLIRGPSGSGKSRLAFDLVLAGRAGYLPPTTLIGDDRVRLTVNGGTLTVRGVAELAGKIEIRGLGIRSVNYAADGPIGLVVDLNAADAARLPPPESLKTTLEGLELPRIPVGADFNALPLVLAFLTTT
ncbi:MAG: serine kinase [Afipia sp. 62-7]|nr:HPr kinase/phosphatase C-terminal domain-containing protein [Afipia sp.]OJU16813.1 MAG: serine kinase [Afipia sp. 62-7]